eukprot:m.26550 g.26550  ORF g.26550 m.26550 type:complete len:312 (-) comp7807_c0_seq1:1005-1940(-)
MTLLIALAVLNLLSQTEKSDEKIQCVKDIAEWPIQNSQAKTGPTKVEVFDYEGALPSLQGAHHNGGMLQNGKYKQKQCEPEVPRMIHYIWLGTPLRTNHAEWMVKCAEINNGWRINFWHDHPVGDKEKKILEDKKGIERFHVQLRNVTAELHLFVNGDLIEKEGNFAGKSDYLRMEVLYRFGGIYIDTDALIQQPFDAYGDLFRYPFVSPGFAPYWNLCNGIFGFAHGSPFLKFALDATRENCLKYHVCGVMAGAGPGFLTGAITAYQPKDVLFIHQKHLVIKQESGGKITNIIYQLQEANWLNKKTGAPL